MGRGEREKSPMSHRQTIRLSFRSASINLRSSSHQVCIINYCYAAVDNFATKTLRTQRGRAATKRFAHESTRIYTKGKRKTRVFSTSICEDSCRFVDKKNLAQKTTFYKFVIQRSHEETQKLCEALCPSSLRGYAFLFRCA